MRPAIRVFGLGAAGRAGNALASPATFGREAEAEGLEPELLGPEDMAGVVPHALPPGVAFRPVVLLESGGNGLEVVLEGSIPESLEFWPEADLEDCVVDDFKRNTLLPEPNPLAVPV